MPDCALIVEEDMMTFEYPEKRVDWYIHNWFIIKDWTFSEKTFRDQVASRSMALRELKRVEKELKANHCLHCPMRNSDDECVLIQEIDTSWNWEEQYANCPLQEVKPEQDGFTKWAKSVADSYRNDKKESE